MEYKTTQRFLETFGLKSLSALPTLRSLQMKPEDQEQMAQALATLNGEVSEEPELTAQDLAFDDPVESNGEPEMIAEAETLPAVEPTALAETLPMVELTAVAELPPAQENSPSDLPFDGNDG